MLTDEQEKSGTKNGWRRGGGGGLAAKETPNTPQALGARLGVIPPSLQCAGGRVRGPGGGVTAEEGTGTGVPQTGPPPPPPIPLHPLRRQCLA